MPYRPKYCVRFVKCDDSRGLRRVVTTPGAPAELTEERIAEAMARDEKVACTPGDQRCLPLPYDVEGARRTCTAKERCKVGWIVADASRQARDVWLDLHTGKSACGADATRDGNNSRSTTRGGRYADRGTDHGSHSRSGDDRPIIT
jgi:hypothetical protein